MSRGAVFKSQSLVVVQFDVQRKWNLLLLGSLSHDSGSGLTVVLIG